MIILILGISVIFFIAYTIFISSYWQKKIKEKSKEVREAQAQIIHMEKMASLGVLAAGIAHEINNPLSFLVSNLESLKKYSLELDQRVLPDEKNKALLEDFKAMTIESLEGSLRIKKIVSDLRTFSRKSDEAQMISLDMNQVLEQVLSIIWNVIKYKISLVKNYQPDLCIIGDQAQLSQVFLNILLNSAQAIDKKGTIEISTYQENELVLVKISDNGSGIPAENLSKIFDPFFSTKKSTGLGLSVSYNIIKKHNGDIKVTSKIGKGTDFIVQFPAERKKEG
ncbi:MAG: ATP-binding protein [Candidatus Omnitrophota bacterium]|nr:hypothetical protein [Candidatus Omnitrophota bacterium]